MSDPLMLSQASSSLCIGSEMVDASRLAYLLGPSKEGVRKRLQSYGKMHQRRVRQGEKHTIICMCTYRFASRSVVFA